MGEITKIEWCSQIDPNATGRKLGAYKSAAKKIGCTLDEWITKRMSGQKWCFRCDSWKRFDLFATDNTRTSRLSASCKECNSEAATASRYGLTTAELAKLRNDQRGHCAICLGTEAALVVDHDHDDLSVRGLLCSSCNVGLGLFGDDADLLSAAIHYLENHRGRKLKN